jgi:hypothetical protein
MKKQNTNNKLAFNKAAVTELSKKQKKDIVGAGNSGEKCDTGGGGLNPFASLAFSCRCK